MFLLGHFSTFKSLLGTVGEAKDIPAQMRKKAVTCAIIRGMAWKTPQINIRI